MEYVGKTFDGGRVELDGHTYRACTFKDCVISHEGGPFEILDGFKVQGSVTFDMAGGEATVKLLDMFGRSTGYIVIGGRTYRADDQVAGDGSGAGDDKDGPFEVPG